MRDFPLHLISVRISRKWMDIRQHLHRYWPDSKLCEANECNNGPYELMSTNRFRDATERCIRHRIYGSITVIRLNAPTFQKRTMWENIQVRIGNKSLCNRGMSSAFRAIAVYEISLISQITIGLGRWKLAKQQQNCHFYRSVVCALDTVKQIPEMQLMKQILLSQTGKIKK